MSRFEGHGVRARGDLSASRPTGSDRITDEELVKVADWLMARLREAEDRRVSNVVLPVEVTRRVVDAMLEVVNR